VLNFNLPTPLVPSAFKEKNLYKPLPELTLFAALALGAREFKFPKPGNGELTARFDVPKMFYATYFSDDEATAVEEFKHRYPNFKWRLWRGVMSVKHCLNLVDLAVQKDLQLGSSFLTESPYFPWHFLAACSLSSHCDSVCYKSFRGPGLAYAIFERPTVALLQKFQPME